MIRIVEHNCESPEANLAWDDAMLDSELETLRFWESPVPFVVLGRSGRADRDVDLAACAAEGVPVLRRSSGGGTVLLAPGCLNYSLVLSQSERPELTSLPNSYQVILGWVVQSLALPGLKVCGSDILFEGRKVSGNAPAANLWMAASSWNADLQVHGSPPGGALAPRARKTAAASKWQNTLAISNEVAVYPEDLVARLYSSIGSSHSRSSMREYSPDA